MEPKHSRADSEARRENCGSPVLDGCIRWQNHSCHIREQGRQYNHTLRNAETGAVRMPSRLTRTNQVLGRPSHPIWLVGLPEKWRLVPTWTVSALFRTCPASLNGK